MATVDEKTRADLSKLRGQAASTIKDPDLKKKFIAKQGDEEAASRMSGSDDDAVLSNSLRQANDTLATQGKNLETKGRSPVQLSPSYKDGIDKVPKTGPAILHKGERVLNKEDAAVSRGEKGNNMHESMAMVKGALGGHEAKSEPKSKKELKEIRVRKAKNHGHIIEHHHTNPVDHPLEEHTTNGDDELASHMMQHMGTENPGESEAPSQSMAAAPAAAPAPPMAGAGAPAAGAAPMAGMGA